MACPGPGPWKPTEPWYGVTDDVNGRTQFRATTPRDLAVLVGTYAQFPDAGDCRHFASSDDPVLSTLAAPRAPQDDPDPASELEIAALADLPYAHCPFKCAHEAAYDALPAEHETPRGKRFFDGLTGQDFASCARHNQDWAKISDLAIELLPAAKSGAHRNQLRQLAIDRGATQAEVCGAIGLLFDPITWTPGYPSLIDGQHRLCALRGAGVAETVVANTSRDSLSS